MNKALLISSFALLLAVCGCNYNHYTRDSPYRGQVDYEHEDETVVRPKKMKTMTVKRDLTTTVGGTVETKTVTETVQVPDDSAENAEDVTKVQRAINANNNYHEININENRTYKTQ